MAIGVVQQVGTDLDDLDFGGGLHASHTVTLPGSPTAGNLLVVVAVASNMFDGGATPQQIRVPTGWTARASKPGDTGPTSRAVLVASKVACPGESASLTITAEWSGHPDPSFRHSNVHLFEFNGGWGGASAVLREGFADTPTGDSSTHHFPAITPTAGAEALLIAHVANFNAYGVTGGPGGGYGVQISTQANDGASQNWIGYSQHVASASGSYGPQTITYSSNCTAVAVQFWIKAAFDTAPCLGPAADFSGTPLAGGAPLTVAFTDESINTPTSWAWDFGDGATSTAQNPTHVYTTPGIYTVALTVTNADGSDIETKVAYVRALFAIAYDVHEIGPPGDSIEFVGTLDEAFAKAIRPVRNEPGSGVFSVNRYSPEATATILKPGNLVKVTIPEIDPDPLFAWFMESENGALTSLDEEGGENLTIGGRGALSYWDRVVWQATKYTIPWWPATMATPPGGTRGAVIVKAGTYRRYTIAGGVITGYVNFTTTGFSAYFDTRQTWQWPSAGSKRFLVHLTTTEDPSSPDYTGYYFHPHQDGVTEYLPSYATGMTSTVLLSDISPDKPGAILYRMFQEGTDPSRPDQPIPLMTIDFTATTDSNGDAWATTDALAGVTAELGETFLETIVKLLATGVIDVDMGPDLDMHAYNAQGRDLTGSSFGAGVVRFVKDVNIADELRRERSDVPVATHIQVIGTDGNVGTAVLPDAASRVTREVSISGDSNDPTVLAAIGLADLNARLIASDAVGFRIATGDDDATGRYLPGPEGSDNGDFWLGDLVTLHTGTGDEDFDEADERVYAITIAEDDAGNLEVTPEVGSVLGAAERALYGRTTVVQTSFQSRSEFSDTAVAETAHPDLATHDALGLATQAELDASVGVPTSPITIRYTFSTTTTDSDPGAGNLRLSNATQYLAVTIRTDLTDSDGVDVTALLDAIGTASGPNAILGYVRLQKRSDPTKWLVGTVSAIASPSGYRNVTIANIAKSANSPFANGDLLLLSFVPVLTNPATTSQDLLVAGAGGILGRLAKGADGSSLMVDPATHLLYWSTPAGGGTLTTVEELDGSPTDSAVTKIVFPNGTLTIVGHVATYTPAGGGGSGALVLLEQHTASGSASLDFTSCISATYDEYVIEFSQVLPSTNGAALGCRISTNGGSTWDSTSGHYYNNNVYTNGGGGWTGGGAGGTYLQIAHNVNSAYSGLAVHGSVRFWPNGTGHIFFVGQVNYLPAPTDRAVMLVNSDFELGAFNAIQFLFSSGNIASGTIRIYGIAK